MPISDKNRKILWGKSGNRCSICQHELVVEASAEDNPSVVGDECHIVSRQVNGPRHDPNYPIEKIDSFDNLLLLCRIHHKMIDDQHETFTQSVLKQIKENHENRVTERLSEEKIDKEKPLKIKRIEKNILFAATIYDAI